MAFTFSHPAAVLPIHARLKKWIPLAPLVVGSMVPDAGYYFPMPEHFKRYAHTLLGTFTTSLPAGILALLLFYWMAAEIVFLLPRPHCEALRGRLTVPAARLPEALLAVLGIVIGAWTHVIWDSFTHDGTWMVTRIPLLQTPLLGSRFPVYDALQWATSVLGLCVLLYAYSKWLRGVGFPLLTWERPSWRLFLWLGVAIACLAEAAIENRRAIANSLFFHSRHWALVLLTSFVRDVLIAGCVLAIGVKVLGLCRSPQAQPTTIS